VFEVAYVNKTQIEMPPSVGADDHVELVSGVCNRDGELLIMVDLAKMLAT